MVEFTTEDKKLMLEKIRQHREKIFEYLYEIEDLVKELGNSGARARMEAYWLPSIKGSLGHESYPNAIMVSLENTITELENELWEEDLEEKK